MKRIVAFTGSMGAGKSTAIETLSKFLTNPNQQVKLLKFAKPLYDIQEYFYNRISSAYTRPEGFTKNRALLQYLGTEVVRGIDPELLVKLWKNEAQSAIKEDKVVACDDCRFDNEADAIKSIGGVIIKITSNKTDSRIDTKAGISNHKSEAGINAKYIDYTIENNGTLESYKEKLCSLYKTILSE